MQKGLDFVGISVVYFCHDGKGNFVMGKRSKNSRDEQGLWDIGAGGLEWKDTVQQTLKKEIKEEYCCEVLAFDFLGYRDVWRKHQGKPTHWLALDFKVLVNPAMVKNGEPHKLDEVRWFTLNNLPAETEAHSQWPEFLRLYKDRL